MTALYDNLGTNRQSVLDLPFREGVGIITQDVAKPHHPVPLVATPTWVTLDSGLVVLEFNGTTEYAESDNTPTADLNFVSGDYTYAVWMKWSEPSASSAILIGRYNVNVDGWEIYLTSSGADRLLSLRHSHNSLTPNTNSSCFSENWTQSVWTFLVISRDGLLAPHYRNGEPVDVTYEATGMLDPDTADHDLVIGVRSSKDATFYNGQMWRPRLWDRALSAEEIRVLYDREKRWFA